MTTREGRPPRGAPSRAGETTASVPQPADLAERVGRGSSGRAFCVEHGTDAACPEHGCPSCFTGEVGYGECPRCDELTEPEPRVNCPTGEDCPLCPECFDRGHVRCACVATLCPECSRCAEHTDPSCGLCTDTHGQPGQAFCEVGHGWLMPCTDHDEPDRCMCSECSEGENPEDFCVLVPAASLVPTGSDHRAAHAHCPMCWARETLIWGALAPPPCASCRKLVSDDQLRTIVADVADLAWRRVRSP